ncbi:MAG: NAD(P)/FAD-dependent oxidoreductase [Gemmatimonadetes bacterium]|nr:NAD(P)/FAD-dependent oxidoreductase [Gemmatimonadota bacterium]
MGSEAGDLKDMTILGGGPTGLFAAFYAGMRGMSTRIVDSLPELGGQLTALYPEKYIFDVGGFPKILAKDLARDLAVQGLQFGPDVILDEEVREVVREEENVLRLECRSGTYRTRTVLIAGGKGAFEPTALEVPGYKELLGAGVHYAVKDPEAYRGKRVLVVGGGDSALDWALILKDKAERVVVVHRRDEFRAHEASVQLLLQAERKGQLEIRYFSEVAEICGNGRVESAILFDSRTNDRTTLEVDAVLTFLGFKPDLGPIQRWGLELKKNRIVVNTLMETNLPGVYAAGDIVGYEGKLDLIATGFAEAAIAVNNAVHRVDPKARVTPGHSTNMKIFKDK